MNSAEAGALIKKFIGETESLYLRGAPGHLNDRISRLDGL